MMSGMMLMFLLAGAGNAGDLLDYTPTEAYWEMRDQRVVDIETMSAVLADGDATSADRLMAIRALGELAGADDADPAFKDQALLKLTPLVDSKQPFVGRYARRSIAWLKGEDPEPRPGVTAEQLAADLGLVPDSSTIIGQLKMANGVGPIDLATLIPDAEVDGRSMRDQMMQQVVPAILQGVEMIGNARVDAVSFGFTFLEPDRGDDGYAVIIARGQYDRINVQMAMEKLSEQENMDLNMFSIGETEVILSKKRYESFAMMMPSNERFILMIGGGREDIPFPLDNTVQRLKDGGTELGFNDAVTAQLDRIDREKADVWVAMEIPMGLRQEEQAMFGPFEAGRAFATRDAEGLFDVRWAGQGSDKAAVKRATEYIAGMVKETTEEMAAEKHRMPEPMQAFMDPMIEMMESMKFEADGKTMTGGMKVDPNIGMTMPMMMFGMRVQHHQRAVEVQEAAAEAADAVEDVPAE